MKRFVRVRSGIAPSTQYTGPVDIVLSEIDLVFCAGDCTQLQDQSAPVALVFYPAASRSQNFIVPRAKHLEHCDWELLETLFSAIHRRFIQENMPSTASVLPNVWTHTPSVLILLLYSSCGEMSSDFGSHIDDNDPQFNSPCIDFLFDLMYMSPICDIKGLPDAVFSIFRLRLVSAKTARFVSPSPST